jgi:hypothetical protein
MPRHVTAALAFAAFSTLWPMSAVAQQGQIAGTVRVATGEG